MAKFYMPECHMPPRGWKCSRPAQHPNPCAATPKWYNWTWYARKYRRSMKHD